MPVLLDSPMSDLGVMVVPGRCLPDGIQCFDAETGGAMDRGSATS